MFKLWKALYHNWLDYPLQQGSFIGHGRYQVLSQIGVGSYGITYRCLDQITQLVVAVKQARPSKKGIGQTMLAWEHEVLSQMKHPFIPSLHDYFEENRSWWLVTDYVEGSTVEDLIFHEDHIFSQREVVEWTLQLMDPIQHVHSKGFVHLDLRIPNIIIKEGDIYLIDFGLAQSLGNEAFEAHTIPPSTNYNSQKKADHNNSKLLKPATIQSDLFDIGHFMLFMLYSNYTPENEDTELIWSEELILYPPLQQVLHKLLAELEPYSNSTDFINDLNRILADPNLE